MMYTFKADARCGFAGDIVLDMFNGAGATCVAAKAIGRRYIGIDLHSGYCDVARKRLRHDVVDPSGIMLEAMRVRAAKSSRQRELFADDGIETEDAAKMTN
jgi:hypothetical protein